MEEWNNVFKINKELDEIFMKKYLEKEPKYYEKNCLELVSEIAELANSSKCFKYWSIKTPNIEEVKEEYADTITMILSIFTYLDIELKNIPKHYKTNDIIELFNELFKDASNLLDKKDVLLAKTIFSNLLYLGDLLNISNEEKFDACYKKMDIIKIRLEGNY